MGNLVKLTNDEKILLHLLRVGKSPDEAVFPRDISQEGIGECIDVTQSHVSYALKSMKKRGQIESHLSHITGVQRRRNAYFLTELGHSYAAKLKRSVENVDIIIKGKDGQVYETKLIEFTKEKKDLDIIKALGYIDEGGVLNVAELEKSVRRGDEKEREIIETPADLLTITTKLITGRVATVIQLTKKDMEATRKLRQQAIELGKSRLRESVKRVKKLRDKVQK